MKKKPKNLTEEEEKRRQELLAKLEGFKATDENLTEEALTDILSSLDEYMQIENKATPLFTKIGIYISHLILKYGAMLACLLITSSLFINDLVIKRTWIFIVDFILAVPLTMINAPHLFGVDLSKRGLLMKILIAVILLIVVCCLINSYALNIFSFNLDWVFLVMLGEGLFLIVDYFLTTRCSFY